MIQIIDQIGTRLTFFKAPEKIVCLVPSLTETLCEIGLEQNMVGVTKFCVHPTHLTKTKTIIGGTKNPNIEKILSLQPDIIIANKEENNKKDIEELSLKIPVYTTDIITIDDTISFIRDIQSLFAAPKATTLMTKLQAMETPIIEHQVSACYLIWKDPYMSVGNDTFIHYMMERYGFVNVFGNLTRYPIVSIEDINAVSPDIVMLSSEPFPFKQNHIDSLRSLLDVKNIILVDGEIFSWYGSRILAADIYIRNLYTTSTQ